MLFDLPVSDDDKIIDDGSPEIGDSLQLTEWKHIASFLCCDLNYIPISKQYYLNSWRIRYFPPFIVNFIIWSSYLVFCLIEQKILHLPAIFVFLITLFAILFALSYLMIIYEGPGFLPYYYPLKITHNPNAPVDYLSGVVTTVRQEEYVRSKPKPERTDYFSTVKRYVIRPDHFCGWVGQFIGKKNHKLFFLFNLYGVTYITAFLLCTGFSFAMVAKEPSASRIQFGILLLYIILAFFFVAMTSSFVVQSIFRFTNNITFFEEMKRQAPINRPHSFNEAIHNWEDVFGPIQKWYTWLLPIGAFHGIPDEQLVPNHGFTNSL